MRAMYIAGEQVSFEHIYMQYRSYAESMILSGKYMLGKNWYVSKEDAEYLAQEAFFKIYKHLCSHAYDEPLAFDRRSHFGAWLRTVVTNTVLTYLRLLKHDNEISIEHMITSAYEDSDSLTYEFVDAHDTEKVIEGRQQISNVFAVLNQIDDRYVTALVLLHHYRFSHIDAAQLMGMTDSNFYSCARMAKEKFCELYRLEEKHGLATIRIKEGASARNRRVKNRIREDAVGS